MKLISVIMLIVFILLLAGIMTYIYYKYEKPIQENSPLFVNITLIAYDNVTNLPRGVDYEILSSEGFYINGSTLNTGYLRLYVPFNQTLILRTLDYNLYYPVELTYRFTDIRETTLITLELIKPEQVHYEILQNLNKDSHFVRFNLWSKYYKEPIICTRNSPRFYNIEIDLMPLDRIDNYFKCFKLNQSLINNNKTTIDIKYDYIGTLNNDDYINVGIYDSYNNMAYILFKDMGGDNINFSFNINNIY